MEPLAEYILRISLGVVYLITAYYIFQDPKKWGEMLLPWARKLLPTAPDTALKATGVFDTILGFWLLSGLFLWIAAILSILHMIQILITTGITGPQYRDIGILGASLALLLLSLPQGII